MHGNVFQQLDLNLSGWQVAVAVFAGLIAILCGGGMLGLVLIIAGGGR